MGAVVQLRDGGADRGDMLREEQEQKDDLQLALKVRHLEQGDHKALARAHSADRRGDARRGVGGRVRLGGAALGEAPLDVAGEGEFLFCG